MENRIKTYEKDKKEHPERWTKNVRDLSLPEYVALNRISEEELENIFKEKVSKAN